MDYKNIKTNDFREFLDQLKSIQFNNEENYINSLNDLLSSIMDLGTRNDLFEIVVEELELIRKKGLNEFLKVRPDLNNPSYLNNDYANKVSYWSGRLHTQMRWQSESGLDPYSIYSKEWHLSTKKFEPNFDEIMDEVFSKYWGTGADWSKEEYLKRIGKSSNS